MIGHTVTGFTKPIILTGSLSGCRGNVLGSVSLHVVRIVSGLVVVLKPIVHFVLILLLLSVRILSVSSSSSSSSGIRMMLWRWKEGNGWILLIVCGGHRSCHSGGGGIGRIEIGMRQDLFCVVSFLTASFGFRG